MPPLTRRLDEGAFEGIGMAGGERVRSSNPSCNEKTDT